MTLANRTAEHEGALFPAAAACLAVLAVLGTALYTLTGGLEHWTFESLRMAQAARGQITAPALTLRDSQGELHRPWHAASLDAPATLHIVDFIYTRCPSICQALASEYQQMQQELLQRPDPGVRLLSISFDAAYDDTAALAAYAQRHHADPALWRVAAFARAAEQEAVLRALGVVVVPDGSGEYVHNAALHLVDSRGHLHAIYEHSDWPRALGEARRLARTGMTPP